MPQTYAMHALDLSDVFRDNDISSEKLQKRLSLFYQTLQLIMKQVRQIRADVMVQKAMVDTDFNEKLTDAKKTYQSTFTDAVGKTVDAASGVKDVSGAAGVVVTLIEQSVSAVIKAQAVQHEVALLFKEREADAKSIKKESLQLKKQCVVDLSAKINMSFRSLVESLTHLNDDEKQSKTGLELAEAVQFYSTKCCIGLIQEITDAIDKIEQCAKQNQQHISHQLAQHLMSSYVINGDKSAKTHSLLSPSRLSAQFFHHRRGHAFKKHYRHNIGNHLRKLHLGFNSEEKRFFTSLMKRYPQADFDPHNPDYYHLIARINRMNDLIEKNRANTLNRCETIELLSPKMLCAVEKKSLDSRELQQLIPVRGGWFHSSPYHKAHHIALRDTLEHHFDLHSRKPQANSLRDVQRIMLTTISYYTDELLKAFASHPLLKEAVRDTGDAKKDLAQWVVTLINRELNDPTPSDYYNSPFTGLCMFHNQLKEKLGMEEPLITLAANKDNGIFIELSPQLSGREQAQKLSLVFEPGNPLLIPPHKEPATALTVN